MNQAVETLLNYNADPNVTDSSGNTALHFACGGNPKGLVNAQMTNLLLQHGAKVQIQNQGIS
jgi:ankyrin repeat protein